MCKHSPFLSSPAKAARGTARSYLKTSLANAEPPKSAEPSTITYPVETVNSTLEAESSAGVKSFEELQSASATQLSENVLDSTEVDQNSSDVVQSIEVCCKYHYLGCC